MFKVNSNGNHTVKLYMYMYVCETAYFMSLIMYWPVFLFFITGPRPGSTGINEMCDGKNIVNHGNA